MYGSRLLTTITSWPRSSPLRIARSVSGVHASCVSSRGRYWRSSWRTSSRTSRAIGRSSGAVVATRGPQESFAAQQRAQSLHPAAPRQLRDDHGDQRDDRAERDEEVEQVAPRFLAAAARRSSCRARARARRSGATSPSSGRTATCSDAARRAQQMLAGVRSASSAEQRRRAPGKSAVAIGAAFARQAQPDRVDALVLREAR